MAHCFKRLSKTSGEADSLAKRSRQCTSSLPERSTTTSLSLPPTMKYVRIAKWSPVKSSEWCKGRLSLWGCLCGTRNNTIPGASEGFEAWLSAWASESWCGPQASRKSSSSSTLVQDNDFMRSGLVNTSAALLHTACAGSTTPFSCQQTSRAVKGKRWLSHYTTDLHDSHVPSSDQ